MRYKRKWERKRKGDERDELIGQIGARAHLFDWST